MPMAFWRRKDQPSVTKVREQRRTSSSAAEDAGARSDADNVRVRARRRLIGAAALLLAVAIVVPMMLDPEPKLAADNIAIDIPSEKTPFTPRLALPPVPSADNVPMAPPSDFAPLPEKSEEAPRTSDSKAAVDEKKGDEQQRARALLEGTATKASSQNAKRPRFVVQAAAPASDAAARDLAEKLKKSGLAPYTEKVDTNQGARYRVRVGPYASRDEADIVRTRLKAQGISANLITL
ncbi:MAG: SPOR domain-containing protein [Burkholderiaceae bacterium]